MSRQVPTVRRREIIYRRSYIDDQNDRFDQVFEKPVVVLRNPTNEHLILNNPYQSGANEQLQSVNNKLDSILNHLRSPDIEKPVKTHQKLVDKWDEQINKIKEICDRLEKLENLNDKTLREVPTSEDFSTIASKVEELNQNQQELREKFSSFNTLGNDSVDELLSVINDTRRDLEEKISNVKQLCDGSWIHLDNKMDEFQHQQKGIQLQINELMNILTSLSSSRPSSTNEKLLSRCSSKSSIVTKPIIVIPTSRSPAPESPSISTTVRSLAGSLKNGNEVEKKLLNGSVKSVATEVTVASSKKISVNTPRNQSRHSSIQKAISMEVLRRQLSIDTIPLNYVEKFNNKPVSSRASSSSDSFIAPLVVDERRNSQPANVFQNLHSK